MSELPYGMGHRMLTVAQVADWFQLTEKAVRRRLERGTIPYRQLGAGDTIRFDEQELVTWSRPEVKAIARLVALPVAPAAQRTRRKHGTSPTAHLVEGFGGRGGS